MLPAVELLDDALAVLVEGCDATGIPPESWRSPIVGDFLPDSLAGWIGKLDAGDERPPSDPPRYLYDLRLRGPAVADPSRVAETYGLLRLAGGWQPYSDFTMADGERTIYFERGDGARTGLVLTPRGTVQTFISAPTTDPAVMLAGAGTGEGSDGAGLGGGEEFGGGEGESSAWRGA